MEITRIFRIDITELLGDTARILTDKKPVVHSRNMQLSPESRD
jgi:hypothetical protein